MNVDIEQRIVVIGNAGGGKSTLARRLAKTRGVTYVEIDRFLWQPGWHQVDANNYDIAHSRALSQPNWVMDGLGRRDSIRARLHRSTEIILVDLPLWIHFWLAAERQIAWSQGQIDHPPGGASTAPPTEALFRTINDVDQTWMPWLRTEIDELETLKGKSVTRVLTLDQLNPMADEIRPTGR